MFRQCFAGEAFALRDGGRPRLAGVAVKEDCRHYSSRTVGHGEVVQRCRVDAAQTMPFACPEDCLFFEPRSITDTGWSRRPDDHLG